MSTTTGFDELTGDYVLDAARTKVGLVARHRMASRVRGEFEGCEGGVHVDGEDPSKSRVRLVIPAASIRTGNPQRDDLLRARFLDAGDHPDLTFTSTEVRQVDETAFKVTGDLALRGVSRSVTVDVELTGAEDDGRGGLRLGFTCGATIDRNDWGVNWNFLTTAMVSPLVVLELDVTAVRLS
ncbi:YceI family protein [Streptomyces kanamyceticus]|uniref:Polyisoprenoid-binding protein n=1 Tax=Streptomyces kanamyceticus TaxID=1967 RepID=A0A5J6GNM0_STRKN|nr:YceI family protein [Streptomyces kanamyceticus]QEU96653.1 polyisoprenoid-binding protein [Streptomyces kanamyceticus]